jgi:hypothetical protein
MSPLSLSHESHSLAHGIARMGTEDRGHSYSEQFRRNRNGPQLLLLPHQQQQQQQQQQPLMTDRGQYQTWLELQLDKVSSACLAAASQKGAVDELSDHVQGRFEHLAKLVSLQQEYAEERAKDVEDTRGLATSNRQEIEAQNARLDHRYELLEERLNRLEGAAEKDSAAADAPWKDLDQRLKSLETVLNGQLDEFGVKLKHLEAAVEDESTDRRRWQEVDKRLKQLESKFDECILAEEDQSRESLWEKQQDKHGNVFYWNAETNQSQWEPPQVVRSKSRVRGSLQERVDALHQELESVKRNASAALSSAQDAHVAAVDANRRCGKAQTISRALAVNSLKYARTQRDGIVVALQELEDKVSRVQHPPVSERSLTAPPRSRIDADGRDSDLVSMNQSILQLENRVHEEMTRLARELSLSQQRLNRFLELYDGSQQELYSRIDQVLSTKQEVSRAAGVIAAQAWKLESLSSSKQHGGISTTEQKLARVLKKCASLLENPQQLDGPSRRQKNTSGCIRR